MKKKLILILLISISISITGNLFSGVGSSKLQFLKFSPSVRAVAMADSVSSIAGDVNNIFYNPGGVYSSSSFDVSISYTKWFQSLNFLNFAGKMKIGNIGDAGIGIITLIYDDVFRVKEENGILVRTDEKLNLGDFLLAGNFSRMFGSKLYTGINLNIVNEKLDKSSISHTGIDAGGIYKLSEDVSTGLCFLNIGIKDSPLIIRNGLSYKINAGHNTDIILAEELDMSGDSEMKFGIGGEANIYKIFFIRMGYKIGDETGTVRVGGGVKYNMFQIDYSFNSYGDLGNVNRISLKVIL